MLPRAIRRPLLDAADLLQPLLSPAVLSGGKVDEAKLEAYTCAARPRIVRSRIAARAAVYVVWDGHGTCRYVGSVTRPRPNAVAERLQEHLTHKARGKARLATWMLVSILPVPTTTPTKVVRAAEGWAARYLSPYDSSRQPAVDFRQPPRLLALRLQWDNSKAPVTSNIAVTGENSHGSGVRCLGLRHSAWSASTSSSCSVHWGWVR